MATDAPYRDPSLPIEERVQDLLARMTTDEKLAQIGSAWAFDLVDGQRFDRVKAGQRLADGIGHITRVAGATNLEATGVAELANDIQRYLLEQTRLGIPAIVHEECLHGLLARGAVCFPQSLGQAATWNPALAEAMAASIARQMRAAGGHHALAPILDVTRDPRWGRIEETYGEDAYLVAEFGTAYVRGLQGDRPDAHGGVIATGKHMVGHGLPEGGLNHAPAHIGGRELRDVFLFPFEAAVRTAGLASMMHAYDDVDGVPCVASKELFTDILRGEWGFEGTVVSDYSGIDELISSHAVVAERWQAAAAALEAGIDVELPTISCYGDPLRGAIDTGDVELDLVDRAVARLLRQKFELGLFEQAYVDPAGAAYPLTADRALAREIAGQSIVLLKNDGILPLAAGTARIAVIGPNADSARNLLGDYSHIAHIEVLIEMRQGGEAFGFSIPDSMEAVDELSGRQTILDAVRARAAASSAEVRFAAGCGILDGDDAGIAEAVAVARDADVAIVVVGERSGLTDDCTCGEARDRVDIGLPGRQAELVAAVAETGTLVVLVLVAGRPLAIPTAVEQSAAVVHAWVPGEEGPEAIAAALFGDLNPGGKLPVTVPRHVGQIPIFYGHKPSGGRSHWKNDYVDGSHRPLWPFGFGLSYTSFALTDPRLDRPTVAPDDDVAVSVDVTNTGDRPGDEVVQLYVRDVEASVTRPVKELRGFRRVHLEPGETRRVTFQLAAEQLAFTGVDGRLVLEPGVVQLFLGTSSDDLSLSLQVEIVGEPTLLDRRRRFFTQVSLD